MKAGFTKVVVILDRSGSMESIKNAMISGVNEFIRGLKAQEGECEVFAVQFDTEYEILFDKPLALVPELTDKIYIPRGGTALIDAMGYTIDNISNQISARPEDQRPERVVVLIVTDGEENSSLQYGCLTDKTRIANMVKTQQEEFKWVFTFMGANQNAVLAAQEYNIPAAQAVTYHAGAQNMQVTHTAAVNFVNSVRAGHSGATASASSYTAGVRMAAADPTFTADTSWGSLRPEDTPTISVTNSAGQTVPTTTDNSQGN